MLMRTVLVVGAIIAMTGVLEIAKPKPPAQLTSAP
jgi:hypothetical protein